jgi:hypothetical protein
MIHSPTLAALCCVLWTTCLYGADSVTAPRPIPLTRPEMKHVGIGILGWRLYSGSN